MLSLSVSADYFPDLQLIGLSYSALPVFTTLSNVSTGDVALCPDHPKI